MTQGTTTDRAAERRVCPATGLALATWPRLGAWRVFRTAKGSLTGRVRESENPADWNRFDLPGQATLYVATERRGAYAEVLASLRPRISQLAALAAAEFEDDPADTDPITAEWSERGT